MSRRIIIYFGLSALMFLVCILWPLNGWFMGVFKQVPEMRVPYLASFFIFLFTVLLLLFPFVHGRSYFITLLSGAVAGQADGIASIFVAHLISSGFQNFIKSLQFFGIVDNVFVLNALMAVLLGGWIFGALSFFAVKMLIPHNNTGHLPFGVKPR